MSAHALAAVRDFLMRHMPFQRMAEAHVEALVATLELAFYPRGEVLVRPEDGKARRYYIIKQGRIQAMLPKPGGVLETTFELVPGDGFPMAALLANGDVQMVYQAAEDTFCFETRREVFDRLVGDSQPFRDFCQARLANLLAVSLNHIQAQSVSELTQNNPLSAPLASLVQRLPVTCGPDASIREALRVLNDEKVGSIVVTDLEHRPQGIFTLRDVIPRVVLPGRSLDAPIATVMTSEPVALHPADLAHDAALAMVRHGFQHICVVDQQRLVGVVSERDLFALHKVGMVALGRRLRQAQDIPALADAGREVQRLGRQMLAQGASVEQINRLTTTLNDQLTQRAIRLMIDSAERAPPPFTWLAFGSEGRFEQTLHTEQDNGIVFDPLPGQSAEAVREALLPLARRINDALNDCGFARSPDHRMASNAELCRSRDEWQQQFRAWIEHGDAAQLDAARGVFDFRAIFGDDAPAKALREWLTPMAAGNTRFLRQLTENALQIRPPLGWVRDFKVASTGPHAHTLDIKRYGLTPLVDGARILALRHGLVETNSARRLVSAAAAAGLGAAEAEAWADAFRIIQLWRMRHHHQQTQAGFDPDNHIDPGSLNELDQRILKEAFRQARQLQAVLAMAYDL